MKVNGPRDQRFIQWIMAAVLVWGVVLAIGTTLYGVHPRTGRITYAPNPLRGVLLLACVLAFLGGWQVLLWMRDN